MFIIPGLENNEPIRFAAPPPGTKSKGSRSQLELFSKYFVVESFDTCCQKMAMLQPWKKFFAGKFYVFEDLQELFIIKWKKSVHRIISLIVL